MNLNLTSPSILSPRKELEFLEHIYVEENSYRVIWLEPTTNTQEALKTSPREFLRETLGGSDLFLDRDNFLTDAYCKRLDFKCIESTSPDYVQCSIEAAPYFGLPNKNPEQEIDAVEDFLYYLRDTFKEYYELFSQTTNNLKLTYTNDNGTSSKGFEFLWDNLPQEEQDFLKFKTQNIEEKIKSSPYIAAWLKHKYSILQKMGPHSWSTYTTECLFDEQTDPYRPILEQIIKNKKQAGTVPYTKPYVNPRKLKSSLFDLPSTGARFKNRF